MIRVSQLIKTYNGQTALSDVSFGVEKEQIVVVLGQSGSGKSVLLRHLIGLEKPDSGQIFIRDKNIVPLKERQLLKLRKDMGFLFQEGALYDFLTVRENVAFPLKEHTDLKWTKIWAKVDEILAMVGLAEAGAKMPSELSGGMKKRAALARAVILGAPLLFCDEPTSGLDPIRSLEITDLIRDVSHQLKMTTVITSHDMMNAFRIADKLILVGDGRVLLEGSPEDFKQSQDPFIQRFLNGGLP